MSRSLTLNVGSAAATKVAGIGEYPCGTGERPRALGEGLLPTFVREEERYVTREQVVVRWGERSSPGVVANISVGGVELESRQLSRVRELELELDGVGSLRGRVVRKVAEGRWGLQFQLEPKQRRALIEKIYCGERYVKPAIEGSTWLALKAMVAAIAR